jgi:hypothetical protein
MIYFGQPSPEDHINDLTCFIDPSEKPVLMSNNVKILKKKIATESYILFIF